MCQDGHFIIDSISFYRDSQLGTELTAEADWKRRGLYIGPQVSSKIIFHHSLGCGEYFWRPGLMED